MPRGQGMWNSTNASIPYGDPNEKETDIQRQINRRFKVFERLVMSTINGARGFIASGAAGCGKTFLMERNLQDWKNEEDYKIHSGALSEVELYKALYKMRGKGQIFAADDCDSVFHSETTLNLLKIAGDLKRSARIISWGKNSWVLQASKNEGEEIPREFEYRGSCMFGTNLDLQGQIEAGNKLSRHYAALLDRFTYLDLGIHTKRQIMVRIADVMLNTTFLEDNHVNEHNPLGLRPYGNKILNYIRDNLQNIQRPSIRIALKLGEMMQESQDDDEWKEMAEVTLFNK